MSDSFQTQRCIQALLARAGLHPKHRFGQHFLVDRNLMMRLVDAADLRPADTVVEVGTGTGSLTRLLAERAGDVHTFEIDAALADVAQQELSAAPKVRIHRQDTLRTKTSLSPDLIEVLSHSSPPIKLVANLPYDVATPLLVELLLAPHPPERLCFTIQREVGERLMAAPGTREYGPASVVCQLYATLERLANVPPTAFWPRPEVESVMLRVTPQSHCLPDRAERRHVTDVVRRAFLHRRKTMRHLLAAGLTRSAVDSLLASAGIDPSARPETLPPQVWRRLAMMIPNIPRRGLV